MDTVDLLALATPVTYFAFLLTEKLWLAREFPPRRGWQWIGVAFLVLIGTVSTVVPLLIPESWLATHRVFNGTRLGVLAGTIVGFVVAEGAIYLYHRLSHRVTLCGADSIKCTTVRDAWTSRGPSCFTRWR